MKINKFYDDALTTGAIFTDLASGHTLPWEEDITAADLDADYIFNHSGEKESTPLLDAVAASTMTTAQKRAKIACIVFNLFGIAWTRAYDALTEDYEPLENYNSTEEEQHSGTDVRTPNLSRTRTPNTTRTETQTPTDWEETVTGETADNEGSQTTGVYGFNASNTALPVQQVTMSGKNKQTTERTGTYETETTESGTDTETETGTDTNAYGHKIVTNRHGNIGVTTSQQMLESELNLRRLDFFRSQVYKDIDTVIALAVYE